MTRRGELVEELLERLATGDRRGAVARAHELLDAGVTADDLLELVAEAQREVGRRWERNEWSIVQEHRATAVSEDVVAAVASRTTRPDARGRVAVACADGEWHVLPARLLAEGLEEVGFDVTFVGGSVPPEHLVKHLPSLRVDALAVSVSISSHLRGAARTVAAAHAARLPVIVGGTGVGSPARAARVGADAYAATPAEAAAVLASWQADPLTDLRAADLDREAATALRREAGALVQDLVDDLHDAHPGRELHLSEARAEGVRQQLEHLEAALLLRDPTVYVDHLPWVADVQRARGVDPGELRTLVQRLHARLTARGLDDAAAVVSHALGEGAASLA